MTSFSLSRKWRPMQCFEWSWENRNASSCLRVYTAVIRSLDLMNEPSMIWKSSTMNCYTSKLSRICPRWSNVNWRACYYSNRIHSRATFVSKHSNRKAFICVFSNSSVQSRWRRQSLVHHPERFRSVQHLRERSGRNTSRRWRFRQVKLSEQFPEVSQYQWSTKYTVTVSRFWK